SAGVTKEAFEKGYREFLADRVKGVQVRATPKSMTLKAMQNAQAKNPDDVELTARLAERYLQLGRRKDASELADQVLQKKRDHPLALYVKAKVLVENRDTDVAQTLLENAIGDDVKDARPLKLLGQL